MVPYRLIERPSFFVTGQKTWISGPDNSLFGRFWQTCRAGGLFEQFERLNGHKPGPQTGATTLGISRVEADPSIRAFYYMIAVEIAVPAPSDGLELYQVPAGTWAIFECHGKVPESIVTAEIFAFTQWLPSSGYIHASAPEMEVYLPETGQSEYLCEFWLPVCKK